MTKASEYLFQEGFKMELTTDLFFETLFLDLKNGKKTWIRINGFELYPSRKAFPHLDNAVRYP